MGKVGWALIGVLAASQLAALVKRVQSVELKTAMMRNEAAALALESERIRREFYRVYSTSPFVLTEEEAREIIRNGARKPQGENLQMEKLKTKAAGCMCKGCFKNLQSKGGVGCPFLSFDNDQCSELKAVDRVFEAAADIFNAFCFANKIDRGDMIKFLQEEKCDGVEL